MYVLICCFNKEFYDLLCFVVFEIVDVLKVVSSEILFGSILNVEDIVYFCEMIIEVLFVEFKMLRMYKESVDVFCIGYCEVDVLFDGIDLFGFMFEGLKFVGLFNCV